MEVVSTDKPNNIKFQINKRPQIPIYHKEACLHFSPIAFKRNIVAAFFAGRVHSRNHMLLIFVNRLTRKNTSKIHFLSSFTLSRFSALWHHLIAWRKVRISETATEREGENENIKYLTNPFERQKECLNLSLNVVWTAINLRVSSTRFKPSLKSLRTDTRTKYWSLNGAVCKCNICGFSGKINRLQGKALFFKSLILRRKRLRTFNHKLNSIKQLYT